jgi:hypothetical protein
LEQLNDFCNALKADVLVTGGAAKPYQKTHVACNAIADWAKAREMNEEPLLE